MSEAAASRGIVRPSGGGGVSSEDVVNEFRELLVSCWSMPPGQRPGLVFIVGPPNEMQTARLAARHVDHDDMRCVFGVLVRSLVTAQVITLEAEARILAAFKDSAPAGPKT